MGAKKNNKQFLIEVSQLPNQEEYIFLEEYKLADTKIKVKHIVCGFEYSVTPSKFLNGRRCPKCSGKLKRTLNTFKQEIFDLTEGEYIVTDNMFSSSRTKIKHTKCGYEYKVIPAGFKQGSRCPYCAGFIKTTNYFKEKIYEVHGGEYSVLGEYVNAKTKTKVIHNKCGYIWGGNLYNLSRGFGCPKCGKAILKTNEEFVEEVVLLGSGEYTPLEEYAGANTKIKMLHVNCNHIYEVEPSNFLTGFRCPKCNQSKGEKEIYDILTRESLFFKTEIKFDDCISVRPLPFDFGVYDTSNRLLFLIEYDGIHHFKAIEMFGGEVALRSTQERDVIKTLYCEQEGIELVRIPYTEKDNLDEIIMNLLNRHQLIKGKELDAV